jgi:hypothetical protein
MATFCTFTNLCKFLKGLEQLFPELTALGIKAIELLFSREKLFYYFANPSSY